MTEMAGNIQRINYVVKHPNEKEKRATFAILKVTHFNDGTNKKAEKVEDDRIKAINEEWKNSSKTEAKKKELLELINETQADLHKRQQIKDGKVRLIKHTDNQKIMTDFAKDKIENRKIVNPVGHRQDFERAILVIDRANLSLKTANRNDLQKAVDKIDRPKIHRRVCSRLNALLTYIGRTKIRLEAERVNDKPQFFSEDEFLNIVKNIEVPEEFRDHKENITNLFYTLFYTGVRIGEAFAMSQDEQTDVKSGNTLNALDGFNLNVHSQMKKGSKKITLTKTGNERITYVIQTHLEKINAWAELDRSVKEKLRDLDYSRIFKKAGRLTFPQKSSKHNFRAHDCRHSYAVHLLNTGINISYIAQCLGNSVLVCEKYYLGQALTNDGLQIIHNIMSQTNFKKKKAS